MLLKKNIKISYYEIIYYLAYSIYLMNEILKYSRYSEMLNNNILWIVRLIIITLLICSQSFIYSINIKEIIMMMLLCGVGILAAITNGSNTSLLIIILFIICGSKINFRYLIKINMSVLIIGWSFVTISSVLGIIENRVYIHHFAETVGYTYGFNYYSFPTMIIFTVSIIYLVNRDKNCSLYELIIITIINYIAYTVYSTRIYFVAIIVYELYYLFVCKYNIIRLTGILWRIITSWGYFLCGIGTIYIYYFYDATNITWNQVNRLVSGRLYLGNRGINIYGIRLLGQEIIMHGNAERVYGNVVAESNYIDSGYLYTILAYGVVFTVLILMCYTLIMKYLYKKQDKLLYGWIGLFMIMNIVDNYILKISINPLILLSIVAFKDRDDKTIT